MLHWFSDKKVINRVFLPAWQVCFCTLYVRLSYSSVVRFVLDSRIPLSIFEVYFWWIWLPCVQKCMRGSFYVLTHTFLLEDSMMNKKLNIDNLELVSFFNGLVFFAPVALLVRTRAGISLDQFFVLQAILSLVIFFCEIPTGKITDVVGYKNTIVLYILKYVCK